MGKSTGLLVIRVLLLIQRSFVSGTYAIGSVSGPIVGGAFAQDGNLFKIHLSDCVLIIHSIASWRWIFWINLPIIGMGYVMVTLFLKLQHTKSAPFLQQLQRIDWFGSVLFIASTTSVLIPISWGGVIYKWDSWRTLVRKCSGNSHFLFQIVSCDFP